MVLEKRPSLTARWVAAQRRRLHQARPTLPTGDAESEDRLYRQFGRAFLLPGLRPTAMAPRTGFFDEEVLAAIRGGTDQIVLVGAGFDGRALRFRAPGVRWFEIDHPATQPDKRWRIEHLGADVSHISFGGVDLIAGDVRTVLQEIGHDDGRPTLFVCEGLFTYLPNEAGRRLCESLGSCSDPGSVLAANFLVAHPGARSLQWAVDLVLSVIGEPRVGIYGRGDPERLLDGTGWRPSRRTMTTPKARGGHLLLLSATRE